MKLSFSKEWLMKAIEDEKDCEVGCGFESLAEPERFMRIFGFIKSEAETEK